MNIIVAAIVGGLVATVALVGGVNLAQGDQEPVSQDALYQYSDE